MNSQEENLILSAFHILSHELYENALQHGFYDDEDNIIGIVKDNVHPDSAIKIIQRIETAFAAEKIALKHSELSEALEAIRSTIIKQDEHCPEFTSEEIEFADTIIRILDTCEKQKLRIGEAILSKHRYNLTRPYKHNKQF